MTPERLSHRQRQALILAANGRSYAEIAAIMGIRPGTARDHLRWAYAKLNARDLLGACRAMGWHTPPESEVA